MDSTRFNLNGPLLMSDDEDWDDEVFEEEFDDEVFEEEWDDETDVDEDWEDSDENWSV